MFVAVDKLSHVIVKFSCVNSVTKLFCNVHCCHLPQQVHDAVLCTSPASAKLSHRRLTQWNSATVAASVCMVCGLGVWRWRHLDIGIDLAGILRGTHGERRRGVSAEWGGVW